MKQKNLFHFSLGRSEKVRHADNNSISLFVILFNGHYV